MKLVFPNGEHAAMVLAQGNTSVGSNAACQLRLSGTGIADHHCELLLNDVDAQVLPLDASAATLINGRTLREAGAFRAGDLLQFAQIVCRVVGQESAPVVAPAAAQPRVATGDDAGRTRVRMALPKLLLRGVSGPTFGKTFAVTNSMILGRQADCDICIASDAISRHHARLQLTAGGVLVEDLGSANGTYVNDKALQGSVALQPGDELRLDAVRFQLQNAASDAQVITSIGAQASIPKKSRIGLWIVLGIIFVAVAAIVLWRQNVFGR